MDALENANNPFVVPSKANGEGLNEHHAEDGLLLNINDGFELLKKKDDMPNNDLIKMLEKSNCARLTTEFDKDDNLGPETDVDNPDDGSTSPNLDAAMTYHSSEVINNNQHFNPFNDIEKSLELDLHLKEGTFEGLTTPTEETCPTSNSVHNVSQLIDAGAESDSEEEEGWNYVSGEEANKENVVPLQLNSKVAEEEEEDDTEETMSQLNPNAAEFVPVSPTRAVASPLGRLMCDEVLSQSPKRPPAQEELDLNVPNPVDFEKDILQRPHETEETISNGHQDEADTNEQSNNLSKSEEFHFGPNAAPFTPIKLLDQSEASSTRAVYGDESVITLGTSFNDSQFGQDDLDRADLTSKDDPMSVSFHQDREDDTNPFDLNKVHLLPDDDEDELVERCNLSNSLLNDTISDLAEHFPLRKPEEQDKPSIQFPVTDLDHEDNKIENRVTSPVKSDRTESPLEEDSRTESPSEHDRVSIPFEEERAVSPIQEQKISSHFEDRVLSPSTAREEDYPEDEMELRFAVNEKESTISLGEKQDLNHEEEKVCTVVEEKEIIFPGGEMELHSPVQDEEVSSAMEGTNLQDILEGNKEKITIEEKELNCLLEEDKENCTIEEKEVSSPLEEEKEKCTIEEKEVSSPLEDKDDLSPIDVKDVMCLVEERDVISPVEERTVISPVEEVAVTCLVHEKDMSFPMQQKSEVLPLDQNSEISLVEQNAEISSVEQKSEIFPVEGNSEIFPVEELEKSFQLKEEGLSCSPEEQPLSCPLRETTGHLLEERDVDQEAAQQPVIEVKAVESLLEGNEMLFPVEEQRKVSPVADQIISAVEIEENLASSAFEDRKSVEPCLEPVQVSTTSCDILEEPNTVTSDIGGFADYRTQQEQIVVEMAKEDPDDLLNLGVVTRITSLEKQRDVCEAFTNELPDTHSTFDLPPVEVNLLGEAGATNTHDHPEPSVKLEDIQQPETCEAVPKEDVEVVAAAYPPNELPLSPTSSGRDDPLHSLPTPECDQLLADSRGPLDVSFGDTESVATTEVNSFLGRSLLEEVESPLSPNLSFVLQPEEPIVQVLADTSVPIIDISDEGSPKRETTMEFLDTSTPAVARPMSLSPLNAEVITKSPAAKDAKLAPKEAEKKAPKGKVMPSMAAKKTPTPRNSPGVPNRVPAASPRPASAKSTKLIPSKTDSGAKASSKTTAAAPKPSTARVPLTSRTSTKPAATNGDSKTMSKTNTGTIKKNIEVLGSTRSTSSTGVSRTSSSTATKAPSAATRGATSSATTLSARSGTTTTTAPPKPRPNTLKPSVPKTATTTKSPSAMKSSTTSTNKAPAAPKSSAPSLSNRAPISRNLTPTTKPATTQKQIKETANKLTASRTTTSTRTASTRKSDEKTSSTKTTASRTTVSSTSTTAAANNVAPTKRPPIRRPAPPASASGDSKIAATKVGKPKQNGVAAVVTTEQMIIVNKTQQQGTVELNNGLSNGEDARFVKDNSPVDNKLIVESNNAVTTDNTAAN